MAGVKKLHWVDISQIGEDLRLIAEPVWE